MHSIREIRPSEKNCCRCNTIKSVSDFANCKARKNGLQPRCRACNAELSKLYKPKIGTEERKQLNDQRKEWRKTEAGHRAVQREIAKRIGNPDHLRYRRDRFRTSLKARKKHNEYVKQRRKTDVMYRLIGNLRSRNRTLIKRIQQGCLNTATTIGCSLAELKIHLEGKFISEMFWENYGKWHVDHIKPVSLANSLIELKQLNHYTNLQPLWGSDNIAKSAKYEELGTVKEIGVPNDNLST